MGCNMYEGVTSGDFARDKADRLERRLREKEREANSLRYRVAMLEEAICGLCQGMSESDMHPQLKSWFDYHKEQPGCDPNKGKIDAANGKT